MKTSNNDSIMIQRKARLIEIINSIGEIETGLNEGSLEIRKRNDKILYYRRYRDENGKVRLKLIKDIEVARGMAQRFYDEKVMKAAKQELEAICRYESTMPINKTEDIYEKIHVYKKKIIKPIELPLDEFIAKWKSVEYQAKAFSEDYPEYKTIRGERMRSKSEIMIADMLHSQSIPYRYEYPLILKNFGIIHPDFMILNKEKRTELYWEHFGKMDNSDYAAKAVKRIAAYEQNGIFIGEKLIVTFETMDMPLNQLTISEKIEKYLA